jgi:hypothetical protein
VNIAPYDAAPESPVLVAVINNPEDLDRARTLGWYRIPLAHAPARIGADFLAFYQTGAFPPEERWAVRWISAVRGYHLATRRELIPEQPEHPRADDRYYRVTLGELVPLPHPVPSGRLRRITFIRTTLGRLLEASEINDLWIRTPAQERLWQALQQAGLADQVEHAYPLVDDLPFTADFAVFSDSPPAPAERIAIITVDRGQDLDGCIRERAGFDYPLARGAWRAIFVDGADPASIARCIQAIRTIRTDSQNLSRRDV